MFLDTEEVQKTLHDKILEIRPTITTDKIKKITNRIMSGALNGHEFDNNELRESLSSLVPEYNPINKNDPIILNVKPEIEA